MADVKVSVTLGDAAIELQGEQAFVEAQLKKLLPIVQGGEAAPRGARPASAKEEPTAGESRTSDPRRQSIATFFANKNPQNVYEAIAVVLYHRRLAEEKIELTGAEIRTALVQGKYRPPGVIAQALTDCRRKYGYIEPGSKKGLWKLSNAGETVVDFDLPNKKDWPVNGTVIQRVVGCDPEAPTHRRHEGDGRIAGVGCDEPTDLRSSVAGLGVAQGQAAWAGTEERSRRSPQGRAWSRGSWTACERPALVPNWERRVTP